MKKTIATLLLVCAPLITPADELIGYSADYRECIQLAQGETPQMMECLKNEKKLTHEAITNLFDQPYTDKMQIEFISEIKEMESSWTLYTTKKCSVFVGLGGQRGELLRSDCEVREALAKIKYIQDVLIQSEF